MIGRAALGRPWLFAQIRDRAGTTSVQGLPRPMELHRPLAEHLTSLHAFYGDHAGVRIARKHIGWYAQKPWATPPPRTLKPVYAAENAGATIRSSTLTHYSNTNLPGLLACMKVDRAMNVEFEARIRASLPEQPWSSASMCAWR